MKICHLEEIKEVARVVVISKVLVEEIDQSLRRKAIESGENMSMKAWRKRDRS